MRSKGLILLLLLFIGFNAFGQRLAIDGIVLDSTYKKPLPSANIVLRDNLDSLVQATISNQEGEFIIKDLPKGAYQLRISFVGFKPYRQSITLTDASLSIGKIYLVEDPTDLDSVSVTAEAEAVVLKKDTVEFNASAYKTTEDASLGELLKKMPGLEVEEGKVKTQGKEITKIIVDGKPFFDGNPASALENIPANMVKKVQVIDEKSEETRFTGHDDGKRTKVINIETKPEKKKGYFGRSSLTYSQPSRYNLNGNINFLRKDDRFSLNGSYNNLGSTSGQNYVIVNGQEFDASNLNIPQRGGITENRSLGGYYYTKPNDKLEVTLSFRLNGSESSSFNEISRQFIQTADEGRIYNEQSENNSNSGGQSGSLRVVYKPSKKDEIFFNQSLNQSRSTRSSRLSGVTLVDDQLLNSTENLNYSNATSDGWSNSLTWRHKFKKKGRTLSIKSTNSLSSSGGIDSVRSENIFTTGDIENQLFDQISDPNNVNRRHSAEISYTEPIAEKSSLRLSYNGTLSVTDNQRLLLDFNEGNDAYTDLDEQRSSEFELNNFSHKVNSGISFKVSDFNLSTNLIYQSQTIENMQVYPNTVDTRNSFSGLLPYLSIRKSNKEGKQSSLSFRRTMRAPSATQLQDVLDNRNPLFIRQGNPNLNASFTNSISLSHLEFNEKTRSYIQVSGSLSFTENSIVSNTLVGDGANSPEGVLLPVGARLTKPENLAGRMAAGINVSLSKPLKGKKLNLGLGGSINYSRNPQLLNEVSQLTKSTNYRVSVRLSSNFNDKLDMSLSANPTYSMVDNTNREQNDRKYFTLSNSFRATWKFWNGFSLNTSLSNRVQGRIEDIAGTSLWIWNMSLSKKLLKKKLDFRVSATDILQQNALINRNVTSEYIQNTETNVLRQVFRFSLSYKFTKMGGN
ncbi:hypothetical protein BFP97_11405 [Roseivirga sp. 4D4]|uniref:TonB-dependent receptor n=1 Tax=Roseivirga sp. 4D4 TaxID=1889784 RepID=UPI0008534D5F|nr:TonB-dependent receptor [Roseivirga sp. 4D4]OEK02090.1 hypothetical protein BFP97_11405 [Roseivirga sp. 4D4]